MSVKEFQRKDGSTRYRIVVDIGPDPFTGKRQQKTMTFDDEAEARRVREESRAAVTQARKRRVGHPNTRGVTVNQILDDYMASLECSEKTIASYEGALRIIRAEIGQRKAKTITKDDIEHVTRVMTTSGRKRGGTPGTGLSSRTATLAIGRLRAAYELAILKGKITRRVIPIEPNPRVIVL